MTPAQFWGMTPTEFWWLAEAYSEKRKAAEKKPDQIDEEEAMEMQDELRRMNAKSEQE